MKLYEPQPAPLIYAYDGGWQVMKYVTEHVFSRTSTEAQKWFKWGEPWQSKAKLEDNKLLKYWFWCVFIGAWFAGCSQYIAAMLIVTLFVAIQFIVLVTWVAITSVLMALLFVVNFIYGTYYKIFYRCPDCHEQMTIPVFACPTCGTEHTRLWPSVYGVFYHRCLTCITKLRKQTKLPTLDLIGRKDLVQKCAHCRRPLNKDVGRMTNVHIPVIGGPSTGKSNYIVMATNQLIEQYAPARQYMTEFPDKNHQLEYDNNMRRLSSGNALLKTPDIVPQAYNLSIKKRRELVGRIAYIYDAAGEAYATEDNTILQTYYQYVHGIIFIIDPFSIELQRRKHEDELDKVEYSLRPSTLNLQEAYERMLTVLEQSVGLKRGSKFQHPIAVVISKTDALGLEEEIGRPAAVELMRQDPSIRLQEDAISRLVEQFLIDNQLGNLVRDLYLQFESVKFFSCSALGRMPAKGDSSAYEPLRVLDPFIWILGQLNVVKAKQERIQKMDQEHWMVASHRGGMFSKAKYYYWDSLNPSKS